MIVVMVVHVAAMDFVMTAIIHSDGKSQWAT